MLVITSKYSKSLHLNSKLVPAADKPPCPTSKQIPHPANCPEPSVNLKKDGRRMAQWMINLIVLLVNCLNGA